MSGVAMSISIARALDVMLPIAYLYQCSDMGRCWQGMFAGFFLFAFFVRSFVVFSFYFLVLCVECWLK